MKSIILIILILGALAGGGWWYWNKSNTSEIRYETAPVTQGDVTQVVTATGTCDPVINVTVGSQISGNISKLHADFNSLVKENEVVAEIDPAPYLAQLHMAQGNVANAQATLELAKLTADRKVELVKEHAAPQADLDTANATFHQAQANLQIQQANLESAQVNLDHCTITSPITGIVISRNVDVGQTVAAAMNAPVIFTIANDLTKMQIDASIAEGDIGQLAEGQDVTFSVDAYPYRTFHGKVEQIRNSPNTVQNVVTYDTVVSVNNDDLKLKPGMTANLSVIIAQRPNVLRIPNASLRFRPPDATPKPSASASGPKPSPGAHAHHDSTHTIYLLPPGSNTPSPAQVHLGISDGIYTEVTDGVQEGDTVIEGTINGAAAGGRPGGGGGGPMGMRRPF
jgi:HlyD family secretion protein